MLGGKKCKLANDYASAIAWGNSKIHWNSYYWKHIVFDSLLSLKIVGRIIVNCAPSVSGPSINFPAPCHAGLTQPGRWLADLGFSYSQNPRLDFGPVSTSSVTFRLQKAEALSIPSVQGNVFNDRRIGQDCLRTCLDPHAFIHRLPPVRSWGRWGLVPHAVMLYSQVS